MKRKLKDENIIKICFALAIALLLLVALIIISSAQDIYNISDLTGEKLYRLPNGVYDTDELQRVQKKNVSGTDFVALRTYYSEIDFILVEKNIFTDAMPWLSTIDGMATIENMLEIPSDKINMIESVGKFYTTTTIDNTHFWLIVEKGKYSSIEDFRNKYGEITIYYQLANPIEKPNLQTRIAKHQSSSIINGIANNIKNIALAISKTITEFFYLNNEITTRGYIFITLLVATMAISIIGLIIKR